MRSTVVEDESVKVARYLNGLRWTIQEELSLLTPTIVQRSHQLVVKVEENLKRKQDLGSSRHRGRVRDGKGNRGGYGGRNNESKDQE